MTFNTKYRVGDSVYAMHDNKVNIEHIAGILIRAMADHNGNIITEIRYETKSSRWFNENVVFSSKKELLKSL